MENFNRTERLQNLERILFDLAEGKIKEKKVRKEYNPNGELMRQTEIVTEKLPDHRLVLFLLSKLDPFYGKELTDETAVVLYDPISDDAEPPCNQNKAD
jgi:hypothetical protein